SSGGGGGGGGSSTSTERISLPSVSGGKLSVSPSRAAKGTKVTLTVTPDKGKVLDQLTVTDKNGKAVSVTKTDDGKYTFTMPDGKVDIQASFQPAAAPAARFTDVAQGAFYADAVQWAVAQNITTGTSATTFSPDDACTRGQIVTLLWRAAGCPAPSKTTTALTDVDPNSYYGRAVLWALEQGITTGTSATTFSPDATCTRGQIVTLLYRHAGSPAVGGDSAFTDVPGDAYYADAVRWAVQNHVTNGLSATTFGSAATCTRGQIVTLLHRAFS
ncbi:MAG: S-layer homology domain-containing protein, partial [Eubacteriales bacterium]|nr:S-layer homology domain-containing protein [Eubacteriales bacterium]